MGKGRVGEDGEGEGELGFKIGNGIGFGNRIVCQVSKYRLP